MVDGRWFVSLDFFSEDGLRWTCNICENIQNRMPIWEVWPRVACCVLQWEDQTSLLCTNLADLRWQSKVDLTNRTQRARHAHSANSCYALIYRTDYPNAMKHLYRNQATNGITHHHHRHHMWRLSHRDFRTLASISFPVREWHCGLIGRNQTQLMTVMQTYKHCSTDRKDDNITHIAVLCCVCVVWSYEEIQCSIISSRKSHKSA